MRLPDMLELVQNSRRAAESRLQEVIEQRKKLNQLRQTAQETRQQISEKRERRAGRPANEDVSLPPATLQELRKKAQSEELRTNVKKAVGVFIQAMCKYTARPDDDEEGGAQPGKAKKTFRDFKASLFKKGGGKDSPPPVRLVTLCLDIPKGRLRGSGEPQSGFSVEFACSDPSSATVEDLATQGGKIVMKFTLKKETDETLQLIEAAKGYFEEYFAARINQEGGKTEVTVEIVGKTLTATGTLSVKQDRVGGVLGRAQELTSGQFRSSESAEILGSYSEAHAKESLKVLQHTRVTADFAFEESFESLIRNYQLNWDYFDAVTGKTELVMERGVYKALQKVTDTFSKIAAAKMSVGGLFKRLSFRVDSLFFLALQEDQQLQDVIGDKLKWITGQTVNATDDLREKLAILEESVETVDSLLFDLPAVSLLVKFRGFNFFKLAASCCNTNPADMS
eukprot:TRINITY_DN32643_c0_g1_i1.p1 TRINITY_DN32643_c0_g1~~TRINITY_DN32643_c0_g1_i1.p1  ORF type:complete len:495 (+),score=174.63 TRINITY_DN32643_c0_g1_i1:129-1487(+)